VLAIGIYLKLLLPDGTQTGYSFQNFFQGETRTYDGDDYTFGAFGFSGGTLDLEGGNISATMIFAVNQLSVAVFGQAAQDKWLAQIRTVWLEPDTFKETSQHSEELYAITGIGHDNSQLSVRLGSPLDAVQANLPRRVLTTSLVGELPSTGNINLS
jgi:hypothetical protein